MTRVIVVVSFDAGAAVSCAISGGRALAMMRATTLAAAGVRLEPPRSPVRASRVSLRARAARPRASARARRGASDAARDRRRRAGDDVAADGARLARASRVGGLVRPPRVLRGAGRRLSRSPRSDVRASRGGVLVGGAGARRRRSPPRAPPPRPRLGRVVGGLASRTVAKLVGVLFAAALFAARALSFGASPAHASSGTSSAASTAAAAVSSAAAASESTGAVVGTVVLLVTYAFFCISETAITTLWPWKVREISDQEGPDSPFTMLRKDITRFLTTILIGSTCTSIGSAALATEAALRVYGEAGVGMVTVALTLVTLILCEIAPKSYAVQHATAVARVVIRPIALMSLLVYPVGRVCTGLVNAIFRLLKIEGSADVFVSEEELKLVLSGAARSGQVDSGEREMIQNVLEMGETPVREVMTPLVRVVGIEQNASLADLQKLYREHRYSRVPVYDDRVDNIVGVANSMRVLEYALEAREGASAGGVTENNGSSLSEEIDDAVGEKGALPSASFHDADAVPRALDSVPVSEVAQGAPFYVPESMSVVKLMRELLALKTHMCIVVNEHGGTIGVATFEDCVEEIVGEIYDEFDTPDEIETNEDWIRERRRDVYDVDGRAPVDALAATIGAAIPSSALYDTVAGFACDCFDRIPKVGDVVVVNLERVAVYDDEEEGEESDASDGDATATGASELANGSDGQARRDERGGRRAAGGKDSKDSNGNLGAYGDSFADDPRLTTVPVRITVTAAETKMVNAVRIAVNDAAAEDEEEEEEEFVEEAEAGAAGDAKNGAGAARNGAKAKAEANSR